MRITREKAEFVAGKLVESKREEVKEKRNELKAYVKEITLKRVPTSVSQMFKEFPEWVNASNQIRINNVSLNNYILKNHVIDEKVPAIHDFNVTDSEAKKVHSLVDEIEKISDVADKLRTEIEILLINIKTYKRCETEFPEAFSFLPLEVPNAQLSVSVESVREKLKK